MGTAVKRQTTVAIHTGVAADPGDDVAYVDGNRAELIIDMKGLTGTSVAVDAVEVIDGGLSLPYDNQTANFNVGARVTGYAFDGGPNAYGTIVADTDGGTTGTLVLKDVSGKFKDDMIIVDNGGTPGKAVVNSATGGTKVKLDGGTWATVTATGAGVFRASFELPGGSGTDQDVVQPREFALKYTFTAVTNADFAVDIAQSM